MTIIVKEFVIEPQNAQKALSSGQIYWLSYEFKFTQKNTCLCHQWCQVRSWPLSWCLCSGDKEEHSKSVSDCYVVILKSNLPCPVLSNRDQTALGKPAWNNEEILPGATIYLATEKIDEGLFIIHIQHPVHYREWIEKKISQKYTR